MTKATEELKCPCCNNPWSRATGMFFAGMCQECESQEVQGLSRANMDFAVEPSSNFFHYANGGWMKANPIPKEYPSWNTFMSLHVKSQENLKELLQELSEKKELTEEEKKVAAFYSAAMNEEAIQENGIDPLKPLLELCDATVEAYKAGNLKEFCYNLGKLDAVYGIAPFFDIGASPDNKNSDHTLCQVSQGGIGLPDRDYYFDEDKADKREAYKKHVAKMLTLLSDPSATEPSEESIQEAQQIYDLEVRIAEAHMTKTENREPETTYNKMTIADLSSRCKDAFDYVAFFQGATAKTPEELGEINVRNTDALERIALLVSENVDPTILKNFLYWNAVTSCAAYLPEAFVMEDFDFFEKTLSGTSEIKPRWKRSMAFTEKALGEALGQLYCAKHFDESCKDRALHIVENVRDALKDRLTEVEWMSESTRESALKKMARFKIKIGYPDKWIDYSPLEIDGTTDTFLDMVFKSRAFHHQRAVKEMNAPTDRVKWFMTPQTVNAYYHPSLNEIVFPAAILQPPFFNPEADDAVNYGAMGAVVGHEMSHGFDDKGRKFNSEGNMIDWWTQEDATEYEKRVEVMVDQASSFEVHGQSVQGKLTCGENIADLGGLRLAYRALKSQESFQKGEEIDGFTPTQRFFLGWAQCWRQNVTKERALQLLTLDPHGPNEMRCNGPLSNIPEFHRAFDIAEDSAMYKPQELRVDIW